MRSVPLGMPALPPRPAAPPWRSAWDTALYGERGFRRRHGAADHDRTPVHGSDLMARALLRLVEQCGLDTVLDVGAGRGELLLALHRLAPDLRLVGVEGAPRPDLPPPVEWVAALPASIDGLVVAHEWLDNVPCHVVEVDPAGVPRMLHVDPRTGEEQPGLAVTDPGVPTSVTRWLATWWPLEDAPPGARAEVGTARDRAWGDVVGRVRHGVALAVDHGHLRGDRPPFGSLRSYRDGRRVDVVPDGSCDITADVAVDSLATAVNGTVLRERDALTALGVSAARPPMALATAGAGGHGGSYWVGSAVGTTLPLG